MTTTECGGAARTRSGAPRRAPLRSGRRARVALTLAAAVVGFAAADASADPPQPSAGIDISPVAAAAQAGVARGGATAKRWIALGKAVAKADRPGLADDFAKLHRAARDLRGALAGDAQLADAVSVCLTDGLGVALDDEDANVCGLAARIESLAAHRREDKAVRSARASLALAERRRDDGRDDLACAAAQAAAKTYAASRARAVKRIRSQDARRPEWHVVFEERVGAFWSVTSTGREEPTIYVVGSPSGLGPQFLVGSPEGWAEVAVGGEGSLFWVTVVGTEIWACGENGRVVRYDPVSRTISDLDSGATTRLWGVWGAAPDDVWIVGEGYRTGHVLRHFDGAAWTQVDAPAEAAPHALYKVWGRASDDIWACGARGTLIHWDGTSWSSVPSGTSADLLTVSGNATRVAAVGSVFGATIVEDSGGTFVPAPLPGDVSSVAGIALPATGDAWAVGYRWTVMRHAGNRWRVAGDVPVTPDTQGLDLHGVHVDATGAVWIAGGNLASYFRGILLHYGPRVPSSVVVPRAGGIASRVQSVYASSCSEAACHAGLFASESLDLSTESEAVAGLARRATQAPLRRVLGGRPSASYLWRKLEGTHLAVGGSGTFMPQGRDALPKADLDAIRAWILR